MQRKIETRREIEEEAQCQYLPVTNAFCQRLTFPRFGFPFSRAFTHVSSVPVSDRWPKAPSKAIPTELADDLVKYRDRVVAKSGKIPPLLASIDPFSCMAPNLPPLLAMC